MQQRELRKYEKTGGETTPHSFRGSRILFLDGGGVRGLLQIEILEQLERKTGKKVTELFDWIVGTSTGAIVTLALVYGKFDASAGCCARICFIPVAKKSLSEVRQLYFQMKDKIFGSHGSGNTTALENLLREELTTYQKLSDVKTPKYVRANHIDKELTKMLLTEYL